MQKYLVDYMKLFEKKGYKIYVYGDIVKNILISNINLSEKYSITTQHKFISDAPDDEISKINNCYFKKTNILNTNNVEFQPFNKCDIRYMLSGEEKIADGFAIDLNGNFYINDLKIKIF